MRNGGRKRAQPRGPAMKHVQARLHASVEIYGYAYATHDGEFVDGSGERAEREREREREREGGRTREHSRSVRGKARGIKSRGSARYHRDRIVSRKHAGCM